MGGDAVAFFREFRHSVGVMTFTNHFLIPVGVRAITRAMFTPG